MLNHPTNRWSGQERIVACPSNQMLAPTGMSRDPAASEARQQFAVALAATRKWYGRGTGQPTLSMEEFAQHLGIERYRRYERGETEPSLWLLGVIRRRTGIGLDFLVARMPPGHALNLNDFPPDPPRRRRKP
jgi:hypothetical protein